MQDLINYADSKFRHLLPYNAPYLTPARRHLRQRLVTRDLWVVRNILDSKWHAFRDHKIVQIATRNEPLNDGERRFIIDYLKANPWTVVYEPFAPEYPRPRVWNISPLAGYTSVEEAYRYGYDVFNGSVSKYSEWYCRTDKGWEFSWETGVREAMLLAGMSDTDARDAVAQLKQRPYYATVCDIARGSRNVERFLTPDEVTQLQERDLAQRQERYQQAYQVELAQARESLQKRGDALTDDNIEQELETLRWRRTFGTKPENMKTSAA